jgi:sporulation protein YlmC with PRC-barrel domain
MTSENIRYRSDIVNTQVIANDSAKRLGVIKDILVDIDRREVVAFGLRDNLLSLSGMARYMFIDTIRQWGDVILVDNEDAIEDIDAEAYSSLISYEVITETGEPLGRVRGFKFNTEDGKLSSLIVASFGLPQIPDQVISTYELPVEEIVSSGPNRLIVFEGSEERLNQLTVGVLERLGLGRAPWERDEEDGYLTTQVRPENQLGTGLPVRATQTASQVRQTQVAAQDSWNEDDYEEQPLQPLPQRQPTAYYEEEEEDNWSEATDTSTRKKYQQAYVEPEYEENRQPTYNPAPSNYDYKNADDDLQSDVWEQEASKPLEIPQRIKQPEYEETE